MKRFFAAAIVAGISLTSFASISYADPFIMSPGIDRAIREFHGTNIRIERLKPSERGDIPEEAAAFKKSEEYRKLQEAIRSNKTLMEQLTAQNVEVENIVSAEAAMSGGLILREY